MRKSGALVGAALIATSTLAVTATGSADAGPATVCSATEGDVQALQVTDRDGLHTVNDVDTLAPGDAWAVGIGGANEHGAALHWNGDQWSSTQPTSGRFGELWGVKAISTSDVWAVGKNGRRWVARHWDGTEWSAYSARAGWSRLRAVDAVATDDVWAVGSHLCNQREVPFAVHWDGTHWSKTLFPSGSPDEFTLNGVDARAADDVWAVGNGAGSSRAFHWDGQGWIPASRGLKDRWYLEDVAAIAPDQIWAVGRAYQGSLASTLVVQWDGTRWVRLTSADSVDPDNQLYGIDVVTPDDVWAVGTSGGPSAVLQRSLVQHWDGRQWTVVPSPSPGREHNVLFDVSADGAGDAWAVGARSRDPVWWFEGAQLFLHWNGLEWAWVRKPG